MKNRDFKGIWIPSKIWLDEKLSPFDKVLLMEIDSLDNENGCWKSNKSFSEFMQCGLATVTRSIKKLESLNMIKTKMSKSDYGTIRVIKMIKGVSSKRLDPPNQNDYQGITVRDNSKEKDIDIKIPEYIELELWNDFIDVRKKLKAPNTERALKGLLKKLDQFEKVSAGSANESIDESIMNGWKGVFTPKKQGQQKLTFPWPNLEVVENVAFPNGMLYVDKEKGICYETGGNKSDIYDWNKNLGAVTA